MHTIWTSGCPNLRARMGESFQQGVARLLEGLKKSDAL